MGDSCFICGIKIGHTNPGLRQQMEKLISVKQIVEHSSTLIISDILSRILKETVLREESICQVCFGLLNDIDFHLKEAQEKTDEITNKFLLKQKTGSGYHGSSVGGRAYSVTLPVEADKENSVSARRGQTKEARRLEREAAVERADNEMSVNIINRNKAKLLSHVLNPNKKSKCTRYQDSAEDDDDDDDEEEEEEEEIKVEIRPPARERKKKKKRSKKASQDKKPGHKKCETGSRKDSAVSEDGDSSDDSAVGSKKSHHRDTDQGGGSSVRGATSTQEAEASQSGGSSRRRTNELVTVNMDELGDLFSKSSRIFYAKKATAPDSSLLLGDTLAASASDGGYQCDTCPKTFKRPSNLQLHKEKVHSSTSHQTEVLVVPESHKCHACPREFTNVRSLSLHEKEHSKPKSSVLQEAASRKVAEGGRDVKVEAAAGEAKATCHLCNKTFMRHFNLKTHMARVHQKVKPFPCTVCSKSFATNSDLMQHLLIHGKGRMFSCELCNRTFRNRDSIILHRKQHSQQKTHFCGICNKGFYKSSCLSRHVRSHTGERPYKCSLCNKGFSQSSTLKAHLRKYHGQVLEPGKTDSGLESPRGEHDEEDMGGGGSSSSSSDGGSSLD